jgi:hypothetical protein
MVQCLTATACGLSVVVVVVVGAVVVAVVVGVVEGRGWCVR